jgi:hypothetical protein
MFVKSPNRTGNHISQLNAYAHVGWRQKYTLNEVPIGRSVAACFANKPVMLLPKPIVLMTVAMVAYNNAVCFVTARRCHPLEEILKSFGDHFVGSEVDIVLLIYVSQTIGKRSIAYAAYQSNGLGGGDYGKNCGSKVIAPFSIPIPHGIVRVIVCGGKISPLHLTTILLLAFQANKFVTNAMPAFFWYYRPTEHEVAWSVTFRFSGRPALINEAKVHIA